MIGEWGTVPFWLETPEGTLALNQTGTDNRRWQLIPSKCRGVLPVRQTEDLRPQGDGAIPHRRWRSGYGIHLAMEPVIDNGGDDEYTSACDADLVAMLDELGLHVNAMIRTGLLPGFPNARLVWTPSGASNRMLDRAQLASEPQCEELGGDLGGTLVEFDIDTPYPYYMEETETDTTLYGAGPQTIVNPGNIDFFPVFDFYAAGEDVYAFTIWNHSIQDTDGMDLQVQFNSGLPGAIPISDGDFLRINFFRGTAYLNGDSTKYMAGIDMQGTDFFPLIPGANSIEILGGSGGGLALCRSNGAWG